MSKSNSTDGTTQKIGISDAQGPNNPIDEVVDALISEYRTIAKKNAENVLGLASTIYKVEAELGGRYRQRFYAEVGLDENGSTVRKLRLIGERLPRFQPYLDVIPCAWTTLYALAALDEEKFKAVVESGVLHPFATMKKIDAVLGKTGAKSEREFRVFVDLSEIGVRSRQVEFAHKLKQLVDEYRLTLKAPDHEDELSSLIDEPVEGKQAA